MNMREIPLKVVLAEFRSAIMEAGITPPTEIIADDKLHRFHIEGHRSGTTNGAYVLHPDGRAAGWFQDFKSSISSTWTHGGGRYRIDDATRLQIETDRRQRQAEIQARHLKRGAEARVIWGKASPCATHPYLTRKGIQAHGVCVGSWTKWIDGPDGWHRIVTPDALLVPMVDESGTLWNLQAIFPEVYPALGRDKDFLGGRKAGLFHVIGEPTDTLLIAEGYATAATVHEYTRHQTIVAFDCGNLIAVARTVRAMNPGKRITLCADNDRATPGNPGVMKARAAALAISGFVAIPEFPKGVTGTDYNDLHVYRLGLLQGGDHEGV